MCVGHDGRMTESQQVRGASTHRRRRDSARVILLDGDGRVLLFRVVDPRVPKPPLWITPARSPCQTGPAGPRPPRRWAEERPTFRTAMENGLSRQPLKQFRL